MHDPSWQAPELRHILFSNDVFFADTLVGNPSARRTWAFNQTRWRNHRRKLTYFIPKDRINHISHILAIRKRPAGGAAEEERALSSLRAESDKIRADSRKALQVGRAMKAARG